MEAHLIRTDRNGTKYYGAWCRCGKCCGTGKVPFEPDNGICYDCDGTGKVFETWVERTPEYEAKLEERRQKRLAKKLEQQPQILNEWLLKHSFTADGDTYVFLGDTFSKKELLKELGAKFDYSIGWHIDHKVEGYDFIKLNIKDIATDRYDGYEITIPKRDVEKLKAEELRKLNGTPEPQHVGKVGEKLIRKVKLAFTAIFETNFHAKGYWTSNTNYLHKFVDEAGNVFVWKTTLFLDLDRNQEVIIKGTIKAHDEYDGVKQTVLTRCKFEEAA